MGTQSMNTDTNCITQLRQKIDEIDTELIAILSKRIKVAVAIGAYKKQHGLRPLDKSRWNDVLQSRMAQGVLLGLPPILIKQLYSCIHKHSLAVQKNRKI